MQTLQEKFQRPDGFLMGIELVSTRGSIFEEQAIRTRNFANELVDFEPVDWISITDNAGGNPMLAPPALGKPILYAGKEVIIHLSCKDFNRNGLESEAWHLYSEGFKNILVLSGDYPIAGNEGIAKPVFDIDSVGLLTMLEKMNSGFTLDSPGGKRVKRLNKTDFFAGAVVTNFKLHENEVMPQYYKLEKKVECGARFIINQIGYDSRKIHELLIYMQRRNMAHVPLVGNVYMLSARVAGLFHSGRIPGVVVSDAMLAEAEKQAASPDKGKRYFLELAAKQSAIYRGLGYQGVYFGGVHNAQELQKIVEIEQSFSADDWKQFAREIRYSRPNEFFLHAEDPATGLADPARLEPRYAASLAHRVPTKNVTLSYKFSKLVHDVMFTPGHGIYKLGAKLVRRSKDSRQGPRIMRVAEHLGKLAMFGCKDCGDCSLPDIAFLCPESSCAKNQRNGPCGGTRDGICEVEEFECIWAKAYDRLKFEKREQHLLDHAPVIQDQGLRGTSSWANTWLERDHIGKKHQQQQAAAEQKGTPPAAAPVSLGPKTK
jgi:methylenetetrahydrofolate reductase (NADPH)